MNGKQWENCIKKSCEKRNVYCKKLADGTANWNRGDSNVRFQKNNECDFIIFNGSKLMLIEAKCHKGRSIPLDCIRKNQIEGMSHAIFFKNIIAGLLILFSEHEICYFMSIQEYLRFLRINTRKSIPMDYLEENCIKVRINKKKVNYDVYIEDIL